MDNQVENRRSPNLNLPAELKVEIVDCLSLENVAHFLANVPNRLIIHHCAPRVRRMLKKIDQIAAVYARTLPAPDSDGYIRRMNENQYTLEMDFFLRYGAAHRDAFGICRGTGGGFVAYPADFFDNLIKHYYQTNVPAMAVRYVSIQLPWANPALWPMALFQPQAGEMKLEKNVDKDGECVTYILRNKNNPSIAFELCIFFQRGAKCYQQMTSFVMWRVKDIKSALPFGGSAFPKFIPSHSVRRAGNTKYLKLGVLRALPVKSLENAANFLANVPNRLIIHHCAPRVRRMFEKRNDQIAADYARTLPKANSHGDIWLENGRQYTPEMDIFLRHGAAHCNNRFVIWRGTNGGGFVGFPANFFDDLIKHYYETKLPAKALRQLVIELPLNNPAPWPTALVQPRAGEMKLEELEVNNAWKWVVYVLHNKHKPDIQFELFIWFEEAKCYQKMTYFRIRKMNGAYDYEGVFVPTG